MNKEMRLSVCYILMIWIIQTKAYAQFWTEKFESTNTAIGGIANGYQSLNGTWTVTMLPGNTGSLHNQFYVSCEEAGLVANNCGAPCPMQPYSLPYLGQSLHISSTLMGDQGALYISTGLDTLANTELRAESPFIDCTGLNSLGVTFDYIENGDSTNDNAELWYFDGILWSLLFDMNKTLCGDGQGGPCNSVPCNGINQGYWTSSPLIALPASADNNPNVRIGFRWVNNDDSIATDPSLAVTNIKLTNSLINSASMVYDVDNEIQVYPSPANDVIQLHANLGVHIPLVQMEIYNSLGQQVYTEAVKVNQGKMDQEMSIEHFQDGVYTVIITGNTFRGVKQLIKN